MRLATVRTRSDLVSYNIFKKVQTFGCIIRSGLRANWNTSRRAEAWHDQMIRDQKTKKNLKIFSKKPNQTIQPWAHSHMARK